MSKSSKGSPIDSPYAPHPVDPLLYRPCVGIALFNPHGDVWLGRRADVSDHIEPPGRFLWQMPQGGIDPGETAAAAARRELAEETGARNADLLAITPGWLAYDFPKGVNKRGKIGQRQKWAAMLHLGADDEFDLCAYNPSDAEFSAWRWGELEEIPDLVVPFKRDVYREIATAFRPLRDFIRRQYTG